MKILLINLDQSTDRLVKQQEQFKQLGLSFERFPAVSIKDFSEDEYKALAFSGQRPLKQSELACFLSHKKAWEYVIYVNEPCVVLEDDAVLVKDFKKVLDEVSKLETIDFLNLEVHGRKKIVSKEPKIRLNQCDFDIFRLYQDRSGTGGYIIFPSGAKKLLDYLKVRPIGLADEFIYSCVLLGSYQIEPAVLLQSDKCQNYNILTNIPYQSVIGLVKNNIDFNLSATEKLEFKSRRIKRQIQLGLLGIKNTFKGVKREINVNKDLF